MKKLFVILGILALFVFVASPVLACETPPPGQMKKKVTITDSFKKGVFDNKLTIKDNLNDNQVGLMNQKGHHNSQISAVSLGGGYGECGQDGGDAQAQSASIEVNQEAKRDHIQGPNVLQPDAKLSNGRAFSAKIQGITDFFSNVDELTVKQAKKLASKASDVTCEPALLMENEFSTDRIKCSYSEKRSPGEYMGNLYMGSDGDDVNTLAMIGDAAVEATKAGATHMRLIFMAAGEMAEGDSWNIGLGGGASVITGGSGRLAVAPNGGLGIGSASAFNELRPEMVFELTFDKFFASKYELSKAEYGYSASSIEVADAR